MYICPICQKFFEKAEDITKHSLRCWKEHHPNHQSKSVPHSKDIIKVTMTNDIQKFFTSFNKGE